MEREIEFKGKSILDNEWWIGFYIYSSYDDKHYIVQNSIITGNKKQFVNFAHFAEVDPKTISQYTGLRDGTRTEEFPEGKKIFEGIIY